MFHFFRATGKAIAYNCIRLMKLFFVQRVSVIVLNEQSASLSINFVRRCFVHLKYAIINLCKPSSCSKNGIGALSLECNVSYTLYNVYVIESIALIK